LIHKLNNNSIVCYKLYKNYKKYHFIILVIQPITCSAPRSVTNLEVPVTEKSWSLNSTVFYFCDEGYTRQGPAIIPCKLVDGKGEWSDNPPICELPTQCMC